MLSFILARGLYLSSKLKASEVVNKSYDQLVTLVAKKYGNQQFRHSNTAALYQIQHHYKVISPGDYILDLGAGPHFRWTQLALGLAENQSSTHKVISNDKVQCKTLRSNNLFVRGNFLQEQIRTKIGLALQDQKLNTILCDISPQFTGEVQEDSSVIAQVIQEAFLFSNVFLQKGGNMVCKVLQSENANLIQETGKLLFHQSYSYRPSVLRERSPVKFLIFKGFSVNHHLQALRQFYSRYRGSNKNKMEVVNNYKGRYNWDPVDMIRRRAKNDILELKLLGRSDRQIQNMFQNDPFININEIMKQLRQLDKAKKEGDQVKINKAINAFTDGKIYNEAAQVPETREQWITFIENMQAKLKQNKKDNKKRQSFQPLGDNEVYMKNQNIKAAEQQTSIYIEQDLTGDYDLVYQNEFVERQIEKYGQLLTKTKNKLDQGQEFELGKNIKLSQVFKKRYQKQQNIQPLHEMAEDLRVMTDEQFKKQCDEQGYDKEIEENISRSNRGMRNKFKNR